MNRRDILLLELHEAEADLKYTTIWLDQCDNPIAVPDWWRWPTAERNRENFLDLRWDANRRYERILRLWAKLPIDKPEVPFRSDLFEAPS
jgi:hypothetical protein